MNPQASTGSAPEPPVLGLLESGRDAEAEEVSAGVNLYQAIRQAIVSLQFAPGQQLSENELSRQFRASRTPIRDALKRLEREGLLIISPRRRTTVTQLDLAVFRQFLVAREALERTAAEIAARQERHKRETLLASVTQLAEELETGDAHAFHACDRRFHLEVMRIANLEKVHEIVEGLRGFTDRIRFAHMAYLAKYDRAAVVRQHTEIADAVAIGDAGSAGAAMQSHIHSVLARVIHLAQMRPDLFSENLQEELAKLEDDWHR